VAVLAAEAAYITEGADFAGMAACLNQLSTFWSDR
jgi:hypothetical protein